MHARQGRERMRAYRVGQVVNAYLRRREGYRLIVLGTLSLLALIAVVWMLTLYFTSTEPSDVQRYSVSMSGAQQNGLASSDGMDESQAREFFTAVLPIIILGLGVDVVCLIRKGLSDVRESNDDISKFDEPLRLEALQDPLLAFLREA